MRFVPGKLIAGSNGWSLISSFISSHPHVSSSSVLLMISKLERMERKDESTALDMDVTSVLTVDVASVLAVDAATVDAASVLTVDPDSQYVFTTLLNS